MRQAVEPAKAVWPGLEGGAYKPLSDHDMTRIHEAVLDILETTGIGSPTQELLDIALPKGCTVGEQGRLCFPRGLMEDIIAGAAKSYTIHARGSRSPHGDIHMDGHQVHFCTAGSAVSTLDAKSRTYRPSTLADVYDYTRLTDQLDNIHLVGETVVATDIPDAFEHDASIFYALISGTEKPMSMSFQQRGFIRPMIDMFDMVLGGEGRFVRKPFAVFGGCPIVSPLRFGEDNLDILIETSLMGLTSDIAVAPQAGATAPAPLAGILVQVTAETLACLAVVNLINPGCAMTHAAWPFVADLRTGSFTGGGGEEAVVAAAAAQIGKFYGLPTSTAAGMSDSKIPDAQAGYEKGVTAVLAALAGFNRVCESAGMLGSLMGCSFESLVIDNDMLGMVQRALRGIEVTDETLSVAAIKEVAIGAGHYLGHPQTLSLMETEYLYPALGDRQPQDTWEEEGSKDMLTRASERVETMLADHYPNYIEPAVDAVIRERFPNQLTPQAMQPGNGRW